MIDNKEIEENEYMIAKTKKYEPERFQIMRGARCWETITS